MKDPRNGPFFSCHVIPIDENKQFEQKHFDILTPLYPLYNEIRIAKIAFSSSGGIVQKYKKGI